MKEKIKQLMESVVKSLEAIKEDLLEARELKQEAFGERGCHELSIFDEVLDDIEDRINDLINSMKRAVD